MHDRPEDHPRISEKEKYMITSTIEEEGGAVAHKRVPWRAIVTSPVVWAVSLAHLASNWGLYQLNSMMPTYLDNILQ